MIKKRIASIAISAALAFTMNVSAISAFAEDDLPTLALDSTDVLSDLSDVNLDELLQADLTQVKCIRFMEYGFTTAGDDAYGLYIYLYNPLGLELSGRDGAHVANMAIAYDAEGEPSEYANVTLRLVDTSELLGKTFHKMRVVGDELDELYANAHAGQAKNKKRRYDVAGVQLWQKGWASADLDASLSTVNADMGAIKSGVKDYTVGMTYTFTGFAKGYGPGATQSSTLKCSYTELATIQLNLQHTNYRAGAGAKSWYQDEVNSVYFSVPEEVFQAYGDLTAIEAEWYEYVTQPIFVVTSDPNAYGGLIDYVGHDLEYFDTLPEWRVAWELTTKAGFIHPLDPLDLANNTANKTYNLDGNISGDWEIPLFVDKNATSVSRIDWLLETSKAAGYKVSRADVEAWAKWYTDKFGGATVAGAGREYSAALFADEIDKDRQKYLTNPEDKRGHVQMTIRADEKQNLLEDNWQYMSFWDKFGSVLGGWGTIDTGYTKSYDPIATYTREQYVSAKAGLSDTEFSKRLFISEDDYKGGDGQNNAISFQEYADAAFNANHRLVLFRFAKTQYYASAAVFDYAGNDGVSDIDGYVAQQTCFLKFDVISLEFKKEGVVTVLACVADPIDVFNGTTPPDNNFGGCGKIDVKKVFAVVLIVGVVVLGIVIWEKTRDVRMSWKVSSIDREIKRSNRSKRRRRKRK